MSIHVITEIASLPLADVRFEIQFEEFGVNTTKVQDFPTLYGDERGMPVIVVSLSLGVNDCSHLSSCYRDIIQKALQFDFSTMIIPLLQNHASGIKPKESLYAASRAYSEIDEDVDIYLLATPGIMSSAKQELILDVADYISCTYAPRPKTWYSVAPEDRVCYSADDDDIDYSADNDGMRYSADYDDLIDQTILASESHSPLRFDPTRGFFQLDESFGETVLKLIEAKGITEAQCYNKANISRAAFYKIRQSARDPQSTYRPTKQTAQALAIALELSIDEADDLLERAGYAFSHSNKGDIIVEYFLVNKIYDIFAVNEALYHYDQPLLGSL